MDLVAQSLEVNMNNSKLISNITKKYEFKIDPSKNIRREYFYRFKKRYYKFIGKEKKFLTKLKNRMEKLRVGNPLDKSIDIGAIVAPVQLKKIDKLVKQGKKDA